MMAVIPTGNEVRLHYGYSLIDYFAYFMTFLGVATMMVRWRGRQVARKRKLLSR
jgi:hypothetical protein